MNITIVFVILLILINLFTIGGIVFWPLGTITILTFFTVLLQAYLRQSIQAPPDSLDSTLQVL